MECDLASTRVLVTGAGGFIGSHLVEALVKSGAQVTCMTHYNALGSIGNIGFLPDDIRQRITIAAGNVEDGDFVQRIVEGQDLVFHLAALIAIPYSYVAPRSYLRTNIEGTLNVLEAARRTGIKRVVHTSTSEVYGTALRTPIDEDHPLQGQSPYSASKLSADKIAESYYRSFETPVVTVRPFNTFGPRQSARAFIPTIISQALARDVIQLGSLTPQRDMTFVSDTVSGFLKAATTPGLEGETINLGTGSTFSIGDFATRILALMGMDKPIVHDSARDRPSKSEVMKLVSDNSKAARLMNWRPVVELDDGLRETIDFVSNNLHLYKPQEYAV
ncbi:MAG: NAD-dependent dehydratase [Phenylobacterium sp.]|uniref:GDP-mannose 4,6-dehydratase n=1 Tax=Phenylobacterium sp. TaxID=1871053 RepID=UPI0025F07DBA|nr:GDP-mannose 4,6-dehydratase [Phenylobacterium sp.]MBA4010687.1 NAD-dependent dehydratase [Phenylobacterium sp.]